MKRVYLLAVVMITAASLLSGSAVQAQNISLTITGIKSTKGQVIVSVFNNEQSFKDTKPIQHFKFPKTAIVNGVLQLGLSLNPGTYGLAVLDDEDGNGEMKKNLLKIPKEGFGFSNFYLSGMSRPSFNDFKFEVKNTPVKLESKLRYM